jgi:CO/xanthine dehydrogenase FAD-binding subunit
VKPPLCGYRRVATVDASVEALAAAPRARVLAGGQALVQELSARLSRRRPPHGLQ